ncbi:hypothetical protein [Novosphingobium sp. TCA1]|uniref:hypothetical protein n=1 Tax=Novosphingobium sp. TCA1 TaxID=2682474 RepID=UPI0013582C1E|nr:hypothetical protein [Novosphingobium sp. TCA1]
MTSLSQYLLATDISNDDVEAFKASGQFDEAWYLSEYPDVTMSGIEPARHFLWIGRRLNRRPSRESLVVSLEHGKKLPTPVANAMHVPQPTAAMGEATPKAGALGFATRIAEKSKVKLKGKFKKIDDRIDSHVLEVVQQGFDIDFYLTTYPDVAEAGVDPVQHYILNGWRENRDPCLAFSTKYYLDNNADIVEAGVNPFFHFLVAGRSEGRVGRHELGFRWDVLSRLKPVAEQIAEYKSFRKPVPLSDRRDLANALADQLGQYSKVVLSFSHDDYTHHIGGVQLLLRRELRGLQERGFLQLHFYPIHPLPFLDTSDEAIQLGVLLNGVEVGVFTAEDICTNLANRTLSDPTFVIHSLLGHNMEQTIRILKAAGVKNGYHWVHDYAALYNNYKLMRNDVEYRGIPRKGTVAWDLCEFARADFSQADEFAKLFGEFEVDVLAPSDAALQIWEDSGLHKVHASSVVRHAELKEIASTPAQRSGNGPLKIGFLGYPTDHKGWSVFQDLVLKLTEDPRYEFYHLGKGRRGGLPIEFREVSASEAQPDLMRAAVAAVELDVALTWSIWPETFCLTAYEALAGGAVLITNPSAGNIVDVIEQTGEGEVLADERALQAAFISGKIMKYARSRRTVRQFDLDYSSITLEVLD